MPLDRIEVSRRGVAGSLGPVPLLVERDPVGPGSLGGGSIAAQAVCSDLGRERWWPDPTIVEHAREVGLLPEVRIA